MESHSSNVLEKQLQQKLFLLENGVARVAHTRSQLKDNVDLVRREISACFGHQLCCLRSREQQLLSSLDTVLNVKDELLSEQQDQLHQAFGACRQGLECLTVAKEDMKKRNNLAAFEAVELNVRDILNKLSSLEIKPRETSHVSFEAGTMLLRRTLHSFGRISICKSMKSCESLPGDLEDYEDEPSLLHKPVQQNGSFGLVRQCGLSSDSHNNWLMKEALTGPTSTEMDISGLVKRSGGGHQKDQVRHWLQQIKTQVETEPAVFEDFEIVRQRYGSELTDSETAPKNDSTAPENLFESYFQKILLSPSDLWLLNNSKPENQPSSNVPDVADVDQSRFSQNFPYSDAPANQKSDEESPAWLHIFEEIRNSRNEFWLNKEEKRIERESVVSDWLDTHSLQSLAEFSVDIGPVSISDDIVDSSRDHPQIT